MPKSLCRHVSDTLYAMTDPSRPGFRYSFHCAPADLDSVVSVLQTKSWVTTDHVDQLKDLIHSRQGVDL